MFCFFQFFTWIMWGEEMKKSCKTLPSSCEYFTVTGPQGRGQVEVWPFVPAHIYRRFQGWKTNLSSVKKPQPSV